MSNLVSLELVSGLGSSEGAMINTVRDAMSTALNSVGATTPRRRLGVGFAVVALLFLTTFWSTADPSKSTATDLETFPLGQDQNDTATFNVTKTALRPSSTTKKKKHTIKDVGFMVAYISQGPAASYPIIKQRFQQNLPNGTWAFFYHSYDEDCDGCIFKFNTSFAEGKNIAIHAAVTSKYWTNKDIKYAAVFDDDIVLGKRPFKRTDKEDGGSGWEGFHHLLLKEKTLHPLVKPRHQSDPEDSVTYQSCTDENFWVFRRDHIGFFYPHSTVGQENFYVNALKDFFLMERCFPGGFMVMPHYMAFNVKHRYSVRTYAYKDPSFIRDKVLEILDKDYKSLGPWEWHEYEQRCNVQRELPQKKVDSNCTKLTNRRFNRWIAGKYDP